MNNIHTRLTDEQKSESWRCFTLVHAYIEDHDCSSWVCFIMEREKEEVVKIVSL